jgi:amino acid adenylation domain-containing protein
VSCESGVANLADYIERSAASFPDRVAVVDPDETPVTYRQLDARAERFAAFLTSRGVGPGDRVALILPKSAVAVTAILGILKARAAYVPIDCTAPASRARTILADCGVKCVCVDARLRSGISEGCLGPDTVLVVVGGDPGVPSAVPWPEALEHNLPAPERAGRSLDDLAYIFYTSGSTGVPKGVTLSQANALSFVDWCSSVFRPTAADRFSSHAPMHFDQSTLDFFVSLKHGASVHLIDDETGKDPKALAAFIERRRLTVWFSAPSILRLMTEYGNLGTHKCPDLRLVLFSGEVFPVKHLRQLTKFWPKPEYYNLYGPTETNVCTYFKIPLPIPDFRGEPYPIGRPCPYCNAKVMNGGGGIAAPGEEGILHISGASVFQGYWNRPEQTRMAFTHDANGVRWYSTGDVVREEDGEGFIYLGRRDRMVKRHGYRIELDEVECALYRHERMREAGVIALPAPGGDTKIVAYLAAAGEPKPGVLELKMYCGQHLPKYMNPDIFRFVDALPRTSTGKVDYQTLVKREAGEGALEAKYMAS